MSDYVPEEIQSHLLKWLPVRSLLRFRSVSKHWKQLIDSPSFIQHHLALQTPRFLLKNPQSSPHHSFSALDPLNLTDFDALPSPIDDDDDPPQRLRFVGTLHGVVCFYDSHKNLFSLWNPSLHKYSTLPPSRCAVDAYLYGIRGATQLTSSFWIDPFNSDFKFIIIRLLPDYDNYGCTVLDTSLYSSIGKCWKSISFDGKQWCGSYDENTCLVIEGIAYWRFNNMFESCYRVNVLYFDFCLEKLGMIQAPNAVSLDWNHPILCDWRGALSLVYYSMNVNRCELYSRQEGVWVNVFRVDLALDVSRVMWVTGDEMPEKRRILAKDRAADELVLCETTDGSVHLRTGLAPRGYSFLSYGFVESLVFPRCLV